MRFVFARSPFSSSLVFFVAPLACTVGIGIGCGSSSSGGAPADGDTGIVLTDTSPSEGGDVGADTTIDQPPPPPVTTDKGVVKGSTSNDGKVSAFLGIPFAAPPVGALRWKPPAPAAAWTTPRDATHVGKACPQVANALTGSAPANDEDCLFLNVWTPASATDAAKVPVMVFFHGGSFEFGHGGDPLYDGAALAHHGVAVVTVNYRIGALGFLAHPSLTAEDAHGSSGNYGLLDQQAALAWVKANLAAFHGDPSVVTIFGESAGAISVGAHIVSPLSDGLFHRALAESGTAYLITTALKDPSTPGVEDSAEEHGVAFSTKLGCTGAAALECMRAKSPADILSGQGTTTELKPGVGFAPNIDGYVIPTSPVTRMLTGLTHDVPYLLGTNADEATLFDSLLVINDDTQYRAAVAVQAPTLVDQVLTIYPSKSFASPKDAYDHFMAEALFVCPARFIARTHVTRVKQTFRYTYTHVDAVGKTLGWGAFHASELPLVFGNFVGTFAHPSDVESTLSDSMIGYWTRFAITGDPNDPSKKAVAWPAYSVDSDPYLELGDTVSAKTNLVKDRCDALEKLVK